MPELSPQEQEELFQLYLAADKHIGIAPEEVLRLQREFRDRLKKIWDAEPRPMPYVFDDFRRLVIEQFLDRLRKQDPRHHRRT
jgi:hypothetical protein